MRISEKVKKQMLAGLGCKLAESCDCFHCSIDNVLRGETLESSKLREVCIGLMGSLVNGNKQKVMDAMVEDPMFIMGTIHALVLYMDGVGAPTFITREPELIRSMVLHAMKQVAVSMNAAELAAHLKKLSEK